MTVHYLGRLLSDLKTLGKPQHLAVFHLEAVCEHTREFQFLPSRTAFQQREFSHGTRSTTSAPT